MDIKLKNFIIQGLRRLSYKWPGRTKAKLKARVLAKDHPEIKDLGKTIYLYKCAICGNLFKDKEIVLDHIEPVVDPNSPIIGSNFDLNVYAERMFCDENGFQVLCSECHNQKTKAENECRKNQKELHAVKKSPRKSRKSSP